MDRRDLLRAGALSSAAAASLSNAGCAPQARDPMLGGLSPVSELDLNSFLGRFDRGLADIQSSRFVAGFTESIGGTPIPESRRTAVDEREHEFREALSSLYLTQTFRDLPPERQFHPEVQRRMLERIDGIDESVFRMTNRLERLDAHERKEVQNALKRHPKLAMQVAEIVDRHAVSAGVSRERRLEFRSMMTQAAFRLRSQSPSVIIDEYVHKVKRATAPDGPQYEFALKAASEAGERYFWERGIALTSAATVPAGAKTTKAVEPKEAPGVRPMKWGAIMLGVGLVVFGVSSAIVAAGAFPGVFGMTVGAVLFAVGLVVLIVGALMHAFS
jgi:hypothetical protein